MLVCPSGIDVSTSALRLLSGQLHARRHERGTRWRRLTAGRQALPALARLRCGHTCAQLAAGSGAATTAYRYVAEAVELLAALAPTLAGDCKSSFSIDRPPPRPHDKETTPPTIIADPTPAAN